MAEDRYIATFEEIFKGIDTLANTKTVVGEAIRIDGAVILPLVDVTCGMAAGTFSENAKYNGAGGMSAKMSPSAVLVIQNGITKLIPVRSQDAISKVLDMIPDLVNKFTGGDKISDKVAAKAKEMTEFSQE